MQSAHHQRVQSDEHSLVLPAWGILLIFPVGESGRNLQAQTEAEEQHNNARAALADMHTLISESAEAAAEWERFAKRVGIVGSAISLTVT